MYINLYLDNKLVDINEDTEIKIKKEFQDPEELIIKEITYTYEMELPTSLRNKKILGFLDAVDVRQKFNRVYDAELYANDILVMRGKFIVNEIDKENYKGNLYVPEKKELKDILGDRTLRELIPHKKYINDWEDITKINNYVAGIQGYGASLPPVDQRDNHICFPYVLYNWPYNKFDTTLGRYQQTTNYNDSNFDLNTTLPAFNVLSVLKDIFASEGYNLIGNVFDNIKFTDLYQSYSSAWDDYKKTKQTPYYLKFHCSWGLRKYSQQLRRQNTSSSAEEFNDDRFKFGADIPLYSNNSVISGVVNKYEMMKTSDDTSFSKEAKTIIIPVSGWYQIHTNGTLNIPDRGRCDEGSPVTVTGWSSRDDDTSFARSAYEFQIKKGIPKENPRYYCYNFKLPLVPVDYTENGNSPSVHYNDPTAVKILAGESCRLFGKNQKTTLVKQLSGFDTSDFICGARFGHQSLHNSSSCRCEHREYNKMAMMSLYNVSKTPQLWNPGDNNSGNYLLLHYGADAGNTYGQNTAQVMVRSDSFSNFEGYNLLQQHTDSNGNVSYTWDTTTNYQSRSYSGQKNSSIRTTSNTNGTFDIYTCVWLEEGDTIYPEILFPYNHQQDKCSWYNTGCKCGRRKHFYHRGFTNTSVDFDFEIGLVTTDENWIPNSKNPILIGNDLSKPRYTDVNQLLPNMKCNDYLNGFLQTFNCRLSQIDKSTYSIDYISTKEESGKIISVDDYCNPVDAVFKRITLPSTISLKWKIDTSEEGYVHGNNSPYCEDNIRPYNQPEHRGNITFENPSNTSGSTNNKESIWSYCWYKTIQTDKGYSFPAPVISDAEMWGDEYTYELAQSEQFKTDYTMRLFYLFNRKKYQNNTLLPLDNYIQIDGDKSFRLLIVDNQLWTYKSQGNGMQESKALMLDYDNSGTNTYDGRDKTLTDTFFNINMKDYYQVDIDMIMPNHIFNQIKSNTKIMFNDGLWSIIEIDGHSVQEDSECTLSLKSYS